MRFVVVIVVAFLALVVLYARQNAPSVGMPIEPLRAPAVAVSSMRATRLPFDQQQHSAAKNAVASRGTSSSSSPARRASSREAEKKQRACPTQPMQRREQPTHCPDEDEYLALWLRQREQRLGRKAARHRSLRIVDVGLNKGYLVASLLAAAGVGNTSREMVASAIFRHQMRNFATRAEHRAKVNVLNLCGACCDCGHLVDAGHAGQKRDAPAVDDDVDISIDFHGFEPLVSNFEFLQLLWGSWQPPNPRHKVRFHLVNAAVSHTHGGVAAFPAVPFGSEGGSLGKRSSTGVTDVKVVTLNEALPKDVDRIDILLTDTEGFDFFVADGASRFLDERKVGMYIFELQGTDRTLKNFTQRLSDAGYHCFFPLMPSRNSATGRLSRSVVNITSPNCWRDKYNRQLGWKNAICIDAGDPDLTAVFEQLTRTPRRARVCVVDEQLRSGPFAVLDWSAADSLNGRPSF